MEQSRKRYILTYIGVNCNVGQLRKECSLALTNGSCEVGSSDSRMQNNSLRAIRSTCDEDVEGESGIILCVCFVCTCECECAKLGLLQQFEKRLW